METVPSTPINSDTRPEPSIPSPKPSRRPFRLPFPLLWLGGFGVALVLITLMVVLALRPILFPRRLPGIPLAVTRVSPAVSPLPLPAPPVAEIGNAKISLPVPTSVEIGGQSFPLKSATVEGTAWDIPSSTAGSAFWVNGTVFPYILGLEMTQENQALLGGLKEGDEITLLLSDGARLVFRVARQRSAPPGDTTLFAQSRPGLTLVGLQRVTEGGKREANYAVEADFRERIEGRPVAGPSAGSGEPTQVGNARVTVLETHAERGLSDLPAGTVAYFVELIVENTGTSSLLSRDFVMELLDGDGNRHLPSPSLAGKGKYGPLPAEIPSGGKAEGTVVYIIPEAVAGPTLTWIFGPQAASELRARFALPYSPPPMGTARAEVTVSQAFLGEGGTVLHVVAQIRNTGQVSLEVKEQDISLSSSAGAAELEVAAPPLPWIIAAGETREVELQFARPRASTCLVTILGYAFEISGLP